MKQEAHMRLTKGDRYIDPKDTTKGSAQGNPYRPKNRPKFLKPSGSKVQLESALVESLLQAVTEHHQGGAVFEAAMRLGESYLAECAAGTPKRTVSRTPTRTQNNLTTHPSKASSSGAASTAKMVTTAHRDAKRAADEGAVWRAVNGGVHKQKGNKNV